MTAAPYVLTPAGDGAWLVRLGDEISAALFDRVRGALAALDRAREDRGAGWLDIVPGYASVLVVFDPLRLDPVQARIQIEAALSASVPAPTAARVVEIPVFYDPSVAPDLEAVAAERGFAVAELIARHARPLYRCHLVGFRPGFPFLGGLDEALATPRLATPRVSVPAGAVAIGGRQTGIYPSDGPGGWRIVGRTPARLFDLTRPRPCLIEPGDHVRFLPIDRTTYEAA